MPNIPPPMFNNANGNWNPQVNQSFPQQQSVQGPQVPSNQQIYTQQNQYGTQNANVATSQAENSTQMMKPGPTQMPYTPLNPGLQLSPQTSIPQASSLHSNFHPPATTSNLSQVPTRNQNVTPRQIQPPFTSQQYQQYGPNVPPMSTHPGLSQPHVNGQSTPQMGPPFMSRPQVPQNNGPPFTQPQTSLPSSQLQLPSNTPPVTNQKLPMRPNYPQQPQQFNGPPRGGQPLTNGQNNGTNSPLNPPQNLPNSFQPHSNQLQQPTPGYPQTQGLPRNIASGPNSLTQQFGQMNVTQQGFNQLWGQQMFDLLQNRHILPEYGEDPPEIRLGHEYTDANNCSPEIFRCTINKIPDCNSLLQKSRLPLGILIHPFKDLDHLPVIQCSTIVRCRVCRTYINPFVYFVDSKRWKCNLCFRVNDLPEEFMYDPVSKCYGDPTRRPEIKSATIEYIAPGEYMLRPPQPAVYLFLLDISHLARDSGYIKIFCDTLKSELDELPGDARTQIGIICYDSSVHFYLLGEELNRPREMTVMDIDDIFLPSPESLLVNVKDRKEMILDLLNSLPQRHSGPGLPGSALGAALQAAYKLMSPTGGRISVFQTCLPNVGPGALTPREDPNNRSSAEVSHLNPATDFYKRIALDCSGAQVAIDLFLLNSQYSDLGTLSGMSKFSGGTVYHIPLFKASRQWQAEQFERMLTRYLTRKIGFEAVMRVRCTRGLTIHTFHGNFFVRSTDLLSLPNVSPDSAFGMQLMIEEQLSDLQYVCLQAALLYTSAKGERRIRVHTLCLPIATNLTDVLHSADQQCIIGLLVKMAVDRSLTSALSDAREALSNVPVDLLSAHRLAQNLPAGTGAGLLSPACLRLVPLYILAVLKHVAFRTGKSTRLDDRIAAMCDMKSQPLYMLMKNIYPDLYPIHNLESYLMKEEGEGGEEEAWPEPPLLQLTAERVNTTGAYLLDDGNCMIIYVGSSVSPQYLHDTFGVNSYHELIDESRQLPVLETTSNQLLHTFVSRLNHELPYPASILILRDNSPSKTLFTERLIEDRFENSFSYYEFLQHIKTQIK